MTWSPPREQVKLFDLSRKRLEAEGAGPWGSDLSVAELRALRSTGFEPAGLVIGTSVNSVGIQFPPAPNPPYAPISAWTGSASTSAARPASRSRRPAGQVERFNCPHGKDTPRPMLHLQGWNWEHDQYEKGVREAFNGVHARLVAQTTAVGGHGVIGARTLLRWLSKPAQVMELTVVGTAVRHPGSEPLPTPFTCHLSAQDLAKVLEVGWVPAGLVLGVGRIQCDGGCGIYKGFSTKSNWDVPQYGAAIDRARSIATAGLRRAAASVGEGVVGVTAKVTFRAGKLEGGATESKIAEVLLIGTAVRRVHRHVPVQPLAMMRLR